MTQDFIEGSAKDPIHTFDRAVRTQARVKQQAALGLIVRELRNMRSAYDMLGWRWRPETTGRLLASIARTFPDVIAGVGNDPSFIAHCERHMLENGWERDEFGTWRHADGRAYQGSLPIPKNSPVWPIGTSAPEFSGSVIVHQTGRSWSGGIAMKKKPS